jgi:hypothetical protein
MALRNSRKQLAGSDRLHLNMILLLNFLNRTETITY